MDFYHEQVYLDAKSALDGILRNGMVVNHDAARGVVQRN
jgi:hypothetical protein